MSTPGNPGKAAAGGKTWARGKPSAGGKPSTHPDADRAELATLVRASRIIVCCGTGGVGKTTSAAALALGAARAGRRVAVVTIDPARRLADALGLAALGTVPARVALAGLEGPGELWALMLDARQAFDALVRREARDPEQADRILANSFYRNIANSLSGTQEYMAVEVLHDLVHGPRPFDLVIIDTPPTRNALDFLDAPRRLTRMLDNPVFRALMRPTRTGMRVMGAATQLLLRSIGKVVGGEVVADAVAFFQAFEGMEEGFRRRAVATLDALAQPSTTWVLVTTARADAIDEAVFFADQLADRGHRVSAVVANRLAPRFEPLPGPIAPGSLKGRHRSATAALVALRSAAAASNARADADETGLLPLLEHVAPHAVVGRIPALPQDVHDLDALDQIAIILTGGGSVFPEGVAVR